MKPRYNPIEVKDTFARDGSRLMGIEAGAGIPYYCIHLTADMMKEINGREPEVMIVDGKVFQDVKIDGELTGDKSLFIMFR